MFKIVVVFIVNVSNYDINIHIIGNIFKFKKGMIDKIGLCGSCIIYTYLGRIICSILMYLILNYTNILFKL